MLINQQMTVCLTDDRYTWVCADMLDNVVAVIGEGNTVGTGVLTTAGLTSVKTIDNTQSVAVTMMKHCNQTLDHRSDVESLFDSEDDINDEGQQFIAHCSRMHSYDLSSRKGIQLFRDFLRNTAGQNVWSLWMDISRLLALPSREDQDRCVIECSCVFHNKLHLTFYSSCTG